MAAYDDAQGVTAQFNKNVLHVLHRDLGAEFDPETFRHRVVWDQTNERIEMRLESTLAQRVQVLGLDVAFDRGEQLRTEISTKSAGQASPRSSQRPVCG